MTQPRVKLAEVYPIEVIIDLPRPVPPILAVGAFLKNTLCLATGRGALISRDVGNLESVGAVRAFQTYAEHLLNMAGERPIAIAHDLHPDSIAPAGPSRFVRAWASRLFRFNIIRPTLRR